MTLAQALQKAVGIIATLLPYFALAFAPVWDTLRYPKRSVLLCIAGVTGMQILTTLIIMILVPGWSRWTAPHNFLYLVLYIALYLAVVRAQPAKLLFILLVAKGYADLITAMAFFLEHWFFPQDGPRDSYGLWNTVFNLALLLLSYPFLWRFFHKRLRAAFQKEIHAWRYLWIIPLVFYLLFVSFSALDGALLAHWQFFVFDIVLMAGSVVVYSAVVQMIEQTERGILLSQGIQAMSRQLSLQADHYRQLGESIEEARKSEHDLRHHMSALRGLIAHGDTGGGLDYIDRLLESAAPLSDLLFCPHRIVNALINHYVGLCRQNGIRIQVSADIPEAAGIPDSDLCVVLGNLLENAIQACLRMEEGGRWIRLHAQSHARMLTLVVENGYDGQIRSAGGRILSLRRGNGEEGVGLSSIRAIAERDGGAAEFAYTRDEFSARVLLKACAEASGGAAAAEGSRRGR